MDEENKKEDIPRDFDPIVRVPMPHEIELGLADDEC